MGEMGGLRNVISELNGNTLINKLHQLENDVVDVIITYTVNPQKPNKMVNTLTDVATGYKLVQILYRQ